MIYLAATPAASSEIYVGDAAELAEVRWLGLATADECLQACTSQYAPASAAPSGPRHVDG